MHKGEIKDIIDYAWMVYDLHLSPTLRAVLAIIYSFSRHEKGCFATQGSIAARAGVSINTAIKALQDLEDKQLIQKTPRDTDAGPRCTYRAADWLVEKYGYSDIRRGPQKLGRDPQNLVEGSPKIGEPIPYNGAKAHVIDNSRKDSIIVEPSNEGSPAHACACVPADESLPIEFPTENEEGTPLEVLTPVEVLAAKDLQPAAGEKKKKSCAKKRKDDVLPWDEYEQICIRLGAEPDDAAEHRRHRERKGGVNTPYAIKHICDVLRELHEQHGIDPARVFKMAAIGQWRGIELRYVLDQVAKEQRSTSVGGYNRPAPADKPSKASQNTQAANGARNLLIHRK